MLFLFLLQEGIEETDVRRIEKRMEKTISDLMATIHRIQVSFRLFLDLTNTDLHFLVHFRLPT